MNEEQSAMNNPKREKDAEPTVHHSPLTIQNQVGGREISGLAVYE